MLPILFYSIWGHRHKDNFEEINAQERNLRPKLHEPLWSLSGKTEVPAALAGIAVDGLTCLGHGLGGSGTAAVTVPAARCRCSSPLARSPASSRAPVWSLQERLLQESSPKQTGCSQGSPCGVEDVRRQGSIAAIWLPCPLSGPRASFLPDSLCSWADCNMLSGSLWMTGEQISSMLTIGFSLCFLLSQWVEIISVRQYSPRNCSIHTAVEAKSWECGQERAGRKTNSGK